MAPVVANSIEIPAAIHQVVLGRRMQEPEAYGVAGSIMRGDATPAQIAALLVAMRIRGETVEEISGFVRAMRERAERIEGFEETAVDSCGTGGDGKGSFNVSTVVAFVAAGAGCTVAKHGNRAVSGKCGSAEVLEALGVEVEVGPAEAKRQLEKNGLCFLFAPRYHRAARLAARPRREIGIRSIFNIVGPLTNPAGVRRQLVGVFDPHLTKPLAQVLSRLGATHCMVVHGEDGLDEITLNGVTQVSELKDGSIRTYALDPQQLGLRRRSLNEVQGGDPARNARIALDVLSGESGAEREIVLLNAGAAIYVGGKASSVKEGVTLAAASIDSGRALAKLDALRTRSVRTTHDA
jgi:anthranilate phosphoribosyltransferase